MDNLKRQKAIIYGVLGALVLIGLVFFLWRAFAPARPGETAGERGIIGKIFGLPEPTPTPTKPPPPPPEETGTPEELAEEPLLQLTDYPVLSPAVEGERIMFYKKSGGDLISLDLNGLAEKKLSSITIVGMTEAVWSPGGDRAAVFYVDGETLKGFLHIGTSSVTVLPQNLASFSWSPTGNSLGYLDLEGDEARLITADASGRSPQTIFETPLTDARITWVSTDVVAFNTYPSAFAPGYVFTFSRSGGVFKKIIGPLKGLESLWSPSGSKFLVSYASNGGYALEVRNTAGETLHSTGVSAPAAKCVWADEEIFYCAVPRTIPARAVLPDDYLTGELNTLDRVVRVDASAKETVGAFDQGDFDMSELVLSEDGKYLFFVNRVDGTLWRIKL